MDEPADMQIARRSSASGSCLSSSSRHFARSFKSHSCGTARPMRTIAAKMPSPLEPPMRIEAMRPAAVNPAALATRKAQKVAGCMVRPARSRESRVESMTEREMGASLDTTLDSFSAIPGSVADASSSTGGSNWNMRLRAISTPRPAAIPRRRNMKPVVIVSNI